MQAALITAATVRPWAMHMAMQAGTPPSPADEVAFLPIVLALMAFAFFRGLVAGFQTQPE